MASATKEKSEKAMASEVDGAAGDERRKQKAPPPREERVGFFHIYKHGQGYWTRMGTAAGALMIAALAVNFLYQQVPVWLRSFLGGSTDIVNPAARAAAVAHTALIVSRGTIAICAGFFIIYVLVVWALMNNTRNADFMIATDSEMKKVNWTTRKELMGSTKVVIFFMFLVAAMLFVFDIFFGYLFYYLDVLKSKPF